MAKKKTIADLVDREKSASLLGGMSILGMSAVLNKFEGNKGILSDSTGEISFQYEGNEEISSLIGRPVKVDASLWFDGDKNYLRVMGVVECTDAATEDLYAGITEAKRKEYLQQIAGWIEAVSHEGFKKLLKAAFSGKRLQRFCMLPATRSQHAQYDGGLLSSTVGVTVMAASIAQAYSMVGNGLYAKAVDMNVLITAALLHGYGNLTYFTELKPYKKSTIGVQLGVTGCLRKCLNDILKENAIEVSDEDIANVFNVMAEANIYKDAVKTCSKEGKILGKAFLAYQDCDCYDREVDRHKNEPEEYFYSTDLKGYIINKKEV